METAHAISRHLKTVAKTQARASQRSKVLR
jgi:hypothetical protein